MNFKKQQLKGVEIHEAPQVGTRTVNILMGEHANEFVRGDIMDANAVLQAFDELKGNVDTNHDTLEELVNEIHINSDKLAIVDGDSNTEGSFRTTIADAIAAGVNVDDIQVNGVSVVENKIANIKPSTKENFGIVKIGDGLNVTDGTISVDPEYLVDMMSYGVEWDITVADPACTRIGNPLYHK